MTRQSVNMIAAEFLERNPHVRVTESGVSVSIAMATYLLRNADWFENGIERDGGNELWFGGNIGGPKGTHFSLSIFGTAVGRWIVAQCAEQK